MSTSDYPAITGGTACASQPGKTGQVLFYELYPEGSGIGTSAPDGIILTFTDSTNFADFAKNQSCQNQDGSATGVIASIDAVNSTIILKDTTGTWQVGDSLYTTSGSGSGLLGVAQQTFDNALWWIKDMVNANQHQLVDSVRGGNLALQSPASGAETAYDPPDGDSVAWCWNAGDTTVTNNNGTRESQVTANTAAGFSIVTYTGVSASNATVGHGLNSAPEFMIIKQMDDTRNFAVYNIGSGNTNIIFLNLPNATDAAAEYWQNTDPTDEVFSIGTSTFVNADGDYVAYCWAPIPGYSAFGSYTGNNNADGPFIYTGMRSAFVMIKRTDTNGDWYVWDTTRDINNPCFQHLIPDSTNPENTNSGTANQIDILSNGFKLRSTGGNTNAAGTYVYACFAENPFGGSNVSPVTAR